MVNHSSHLDSSSPLSAALNLLPLSRRRLQVISAFCQHLHLRCREGLYTYHSRHPPRLITCQESDCGTNVPARPFGLQDAPRFSSLACCFAHAGTVHHGCVDHSGANAVYADTGWAVVDGHCAGHVLIIDVISVLSLKREGEERDLRLWRLWR